MWTVTFVLALVAKPPPPVDWRVCTPTVAKEALKPYVGRFPSWLESNCKYALASVHNYPVALFAFRETSPSGQPIALSYFANDAVIRYYGVRTSMWTDYRASRGPLPLLPDEYTLV